MYLYCKVTTATRIAREWNFAVKHWKAFWIGPFFILDNTPSARNVMRGASSKEMCHNMVEYLQAASRWLCHPRRSQVGPESAWWELALDKGSHYTLIKQYELWNVLLLLNRSLCESKHENRFLDLLFLIPEKSEMFSKIHLELFPAGSNQPAGFPQFLTFWCGIELTLCSDMGSQSMLLLFKETFSWWWCRAKKFQRISMWEGWNRYCPSQEEESWFHAWFHGLFGWFLSGSGSCLSWFHAWFHVLFGWFLSGSGPLVLCDMNWVGGLARGASSEERRVRPESSSADETRKSKGMLCITVHM